MHKSGGAQSPWTIHHKLGGGGWGGGFCAPVHRGQTNFPGGAGGQVGASPLFTVSVGLGGSGPSRHGPCTEQAGTRTPLTPHCPLRTETTPICTPGAWGVCHSSQWPPGGAHNIEASLLLTPPPPEGTPPPPGPCPGIPPDAPPNGQGACHMHKAIKAVGAWDNGTGPGSHRHLRRSPALAGTGGPPSPSPVQCPTPISTSGPPSRSPTAGPMTAPSPAMQTTRPWPPHPTDHQRDWLWGVQWSAALGSRPHRHRHHPHAACPCLWRSGGITVMVCGAVRHGAAAEHAPAAAAVAASAATVRGTGADTKAPATTAAPAAAAATARLTTAAANAQATTAAVAAAAMVAITTTVVAAPMDNSSSSSSGGGKPDKQPKDQGPTAQCR